MIMKLSSLLIAFVLLTTAANANLPADIGIMASIRTASGCSTFGISSELFEVDATCSSSYGGSGTTWSNLVASPADGSSQSAYNFTLEASPTFTGSAGSSAAYFAMGGTNYFEISGGNTAALGNIHKTTGGQPVTMCIAFQTPSSIAAVNLMGTEGSGGSGTGWSMRVQSATALRNVHVVGSTGSNTTYTTTFSASTNYLVCIAVDFTGASIKFANNANSFTGATLTHGTTTAAAAHAFQIGAADTLAIVTSGTRIYGAYGFNALLSDANLASVVTALNARHGRTYALVVLRPAVRYAANDNQTLGHIEATVVDTKTVTECDRSDPDSDCLPVVPVPDCPIGHPALDCIPVE